MSSPEWKISHHGDSETEILRQNLPAFVADIADILDTDQMRVFVEDNNHWTGEFPGDHSRIGINMVRPGILRKLDLYWNPQTRCVIHNYLILEDAYRGNGLGTAITLRAVEFAKSLGAATFVVEDIENPRWKNHLLTIGFLPTTSHNKLMLPL